jgi:threonine dehydrogenase-like Zn-dependent dehydrogenase
MSSRNATRKDFEYVMNNINNQSINPFNYVTHKIPFEKVKESFPSLLDPANTVIKAMIMMDQ